jgi:hypothetical protein
VHAAGQAMAHGRFEKYGMHAYHISLKSVYFPKQSKKKASPAKEGFGWC